MANSKKQVTEVVWSEETISLDKPSSAYELSKSLKKVIVSSGLYTNVKGKNYVNVEGWQLAGEFTGIFPKVKSVERVETAKPLQSGEDEIKYRAEVSLFDYKSGRTVGFGVAFCSNAEYSKRNFDEYAIASMAQTRAVSKAYRLTLGWLMKLAGYEATPADEMPAEVVASADESPITPADEPWRSAGKPTEKQLSLLAYLLEGLGKPQHEIDDVTTKARRLSRATVSAWIDDARRRTDANKETAKKRFADIQATHNAFSKAVKAGLGSVDDEVDARAEQEMRESAEGLERSAVLQEERTAGYHE